MITIGVTRFPQGIEVGDSTTAATFSIGGTSITPLHYATAGYELVAGTIVVPSGASGTAFIPSGLTAVSFFSAMLYAPLNLGTALVSLAGSVSGGSAVLLGYGQNEGGTLIASSANGTAMYLAIGTQ